MKYIKLFENLSNPEVGDYAICKFEFSPDVNKFLQNNVGKIVSVTGFPSPYVVEFENATKKLSPYIMDGRKWFDRDDIIKWSKNKEELEAILITNKYNL